MNISKYLLLIFSFILFIVTSFRFYIVVCGWRELGRMPNFKDGLTVFKPIFIDTRSDEILIFAAQLLTPLFILIMALFFFRILVKNGEGLWLSFPLLTVIFEILFRATPGYGYLMMN